MANLDLDMFGYNYGMSTGHGVVVFKLRQPGKKPVYRAVQSFAGEFSLDEWMKRSDWMDQSRAEVFLEAVKNVVFSRSHQMGAALDGVGMLFNGLLPLPHFGADWELRTGFSDGQSLGMELVHGVKLGKLVEVMREFDTAFERVRQ